VRKIYCAVDPTLAIVDEAIEWGADLLITHHPLFYRSVHSISGFGFRGEIVRRLVEARCGLWVGHTNADAAVRGVSDALADALGVTNTKPLVLRSTDANSPDSKVGIGRVGTLEQPTQPVTLKEFAEHVKKVLPPTQLGITVAGDLCQPIKTVAILGGAGDSEFDAVRAAKADVYVTSDLRHHPVLDARNQATYEVYQSAKLGYNHSGTSLSFINTPHYASEKLWFNYALEDIPQAIRKVTGVNVEMRLSPTNTDPWVMRL
jgi:dinuclear metal center YbgI/SA1388 family protein